MPRNSVSYLVSAIEIHIVRISVGYSQISEHRHDPMKQMQVTLPDWDSLALGEEILW